MKVYLGRRTDAGGIHLGLVEGLLDLQLREVGLEHNDARRKVQSRFRSRLLELKKRSYKYLAL